jgi:hypothetical protein
MELNNLYLSEIKDEFTRENFRKLMEAFRAVYLFRNMKLLEFTVLADGTGLIQNHFLGFRPTDLIQVSVVGDGVLSWNHYEFDDVSVNFDVASLTVPTTVRVLVGRLED